MSRTRTGLAGAVKAVATTCPTCAEEVATAQCRVCRRAGMSTILCLGRVPLANEFVAQGSPAPARYPLHLMHCDGCLLAQLATSEPPERLFREYAFFSAASSPNHAHASRLLGIAETEWGLAPGGLVVDIGSNDGSLLKPYAAAGYRVLGVDPARNVGTHARAEGIPTVEAFFSAEVGAALRRESGRASLVHANNVLAHVPDVRDVLTGIRLLLEGGDGALVLETPSATELIRRGLYDTIYHEHLYYYSFTALDRLLRSVGLVPVHVEAIDTHGGSLRVVAQPEPGRVRDSVRQRLSEERALGVHSSAFYAGFADRVGCFLGQVREELRAIVARGHRLAGFGAAAKATIMVSATGTPLCYICDSTPYKQGRLLPGTQVPIVAPTQLLHDVPEYCLILAWNYADTIVAQNESYLSRGGVFIIAVDYRLEYVTARSRTGAVPRGSAP